MRPERASHSSRVSRLVAKHVKVLIVGAGGQGHVFFLSGTVHSRPADRPSSLQPSRTQLSAHCTGRVFPCRSGSARPSCNAYPFAGWLPRSEEWSQNEVAEGGFFLSVHTRSFYVRCELQRRIPYVRRTTNDHIYCICILCNVSRRIVLDILLA